MNFLQQDLLQNLSPVKLNKNSISALPTRKLQENNINYSENHSASTNCESDNDSLKSFQQQQGFKQAKKQQQAQNYKTEICRNWKVSGSCQYGKKCKYAHGEMELMNKQGVSEFYKTRECKLFHQEGYCSYGIRCHFIHVNKNLQDVQSESKVTEFDRLQHGILPNKKQSRFEFAQCNNDSLQALQQLQNLNDFCTAPMVIA